MATKTTKAKKKVVEVDALTPAQRAWVTALRSGKYKQGKGRLTHAGRNCCLGVACRVLEPLHTGSFGEDFYNNEYKPGTWKSEQSLCGSAEWALNDLNLHDEVGRFDGEAVEVGKKQYHNLVSLNDDGKFSFAQIADLIESRPQDFFYQPGDEGL